MTKKMIALMVGLVVLPAALTYGATTISTLADLQAMAGDLAGDYVLANDIDASDTSGWNAGAGFAPIGSQATPFTGTFDGNGHVIDNLFIDRPATDEVGLFGATDGSTISNVGLDNADVTGAFITGTLVGHAEATTLTGVWSTGSVTGKNAVGGLVGRHLGAGLMSDCYSTVSATGVDYVGGLTGEHFNNAQITNCMVGGAVKGRNFVGGLAGTNHLAASIVNAAAFGNVEGSNFVGGLVGIHRDGASISTSFSRGNVDGKISVGGLVGHANASIQDAYSQGDVSGTSYVGGIAGINLGLIDNTYAVGCVTGGSNIGAVIGSNTGTVTDSFFRLAFQIPDQPEEDAPLCATTGVGEGDGNGIVGVPDPMMRLSATFTTGEPGADWDFETIWNIIEEESYPFFRWGRPVTLTITSDEPDPSAVGQAVVVNYELTFVGPAIIAPTGAVTVTDGVDSCSGSVAAGTCTVNLTTPGTRTLTASYEGDTYFLPASDTEEHQVGQFSSITIVKQTDPDGSDASFAFSGDLGEFSLTDGQSRTFDEIGPGNYRIAEQPAEGWSLEGVTCDGGEWGVDGDLYVSVGLEDAITCTFTNACEGTSGPQFIGCPSDISVPAAAGGCTAVVNWTPPTAVDDCQVASVTGTHTPGSAFRVGTTRVTYTAQDNAGNVAECVFRITVTDDQAPDLVCQNMTVQLDEFGNASILPEDVFDAEASSDNCGTIILESVAPSTFDCDDIGTQAVLLTAVDDRGNSATCEATVTVEDPIGPTIEGCPADIEVFTEPGAGSAPASWTAPTVSDNCPRVVMSATHNAGAAFPVGTTSITYTAADSANQAVCDFSVTVIDGENPQFVECPTNIAQGTDPQSCSAVVTWDPPLATDNVDVVEITSSHVPGDTFPVGQTTVVYRAFDAQGNSATCTFLVTIEDEGMPNLTCPADMELAAGDDGTAILGELEVVADDDCSDMLTIEQNPPAGTALAVGAQTVTVSATDDAGNTATCTTTVTVVDETDPVIEECPQGIVIETDENCQAEMIDLRLRLIARDNVDTDLQIEQSLAERTPLDGPGEYEVTLTVTDDAGNVAECTTVVTVVDALAPQLSCPEDITVEAGTLLDPATTGQATADDGCEGPVDVTYADSESEVADVAVCPIARVVVRTWSATDSIGNTITCEQTISVLDVDSDGDGVVDCEDECPANADKADAGECGCDVAETDSDGDGTPDCVDACPADAAKTAPGECGCGEPDVDTDGDGTNDCLDNCPNDPNKIEPGTCGCGAIESPDCDSDGDGVSNGIEDGGLNGGDSNEDGTPDKFQPWVVSVPTIFGDYVRIMTDSDLAFTETAAVGNPDPDATPEGVAFPHGFFTWNLSGMGSGGSASVEILWPAGGTLNSYYAHGEADGFTSLTVTIDGTTSTVTFADGGAGDSDQADDGTLQTVSGVAGEEGEPQPSPGVLEEAIVTTTTTNYGFCGPFGVVSIGMMSFGFLGLKGLFGAPALMRRREQD